MGGLAFKAKTRRIEKEEIEPTLNWLASKTGFSSGYLSGNLLGSAGKSASSGDLDINMDQDKFDKTVVLNALITALGANDVKDRRHVNQIFTCVPIRGDSLNGYVQIDFMFGDVAWQAFSYYSAGEESRYKGLFRTELVKAAVAFNSDWVKTENDQVVARVGPTFFHDRGCVWRYRHRPERKDKKGRVLAYVELTEQEFLLLYPDAIKASNTVVDTPEGVSELIFGDPNELAAFEMYETLSERLKTFYGTKDYATIMQIFEERLNSLKVDIPKDIADEILAATSAAASTP